MQNSSGFSFVELFVAMVVLGILAALAIPSYLNHVSKARESEAITQISTILKLQQAYLAQHGDFTRDDDFEVLSLSDRGNHYTYRIRQVRDQIRNVAAIAIPANSDLRGFIGAVAVLDGTHVSVLCKSVKAGVTLGWDNVIVDDGVVRCGDGVVAVK